jgi:amino acid adenylation domain-containing protein
MSDLAQRIATLSPEKQALLLKRMNRQAAGEPQPIPNRPPGDAPLSFAQERLWFLDQLVPNSPLYNVPSTLRLLGSLDLAALRRSMQAVIVRHESLRTTFVSRDGRPSQQIAPSLRLLCPLLDVSAVPVAEREAAVLDILRAAAAAPFDLARGPLVRALLVRLAPTDHVLLFSLHHIISDGWSMGVLIRELAALYATFVGDQPMTLPPLPIQYADFAHWQREWLQGDVLQSQLLYWQRQLAGMATLQLPVNHPRPSFPTFRGARHSLHLPAALRSDLLALSRSAGATLFMTLLAAFQALLARLSGQTDIPIGSPIANRTRPELEGLIGFFVNTLVLRGDLSANPTFVELLIRIRAMTLDAYAHQDLPFEQLVEALQLPRDPSRNPLFQVMFVLQNAPLPPLELPRLRLEPIDVTPETAKFDLWLAVGEHNDGLGGTLEYNTDLFDTTTILRLRGQLLALLDGIAANPTCHLADLPLLRAAERQQLLHEWNATAAAFAEHACVHTRFEAQAIRTPDAVALAFGHVQLSYAALNARANQLARVLRLLGIGEGTRVGICTLRGIEPIVGLLAILKAGAAYVPLDPAAPAERRLWMLADARASALLTQTALCADFERAMLPTICLDADWVRALGVARATDNPQLGISAQQLLYVIYTSGSTGVPKGVAMSHRALVNLLDWQLAYLGQDTTTRFVQFASLAFDVSYQEIFPTLASGGTVVLIDEEQRRDARALGRELAAQRVERIYLPYIGLQQLAEAGTDGLRLGALRDVIVSGEQLQLTPAIERLFEGLPGRALHNFYGPSESHAVSSYRVEGAPAAWARRMPIGRAIANTQMYVLDQRLAVVPIGVIGELYIGGICLADGYLGRPDLSADRFIPNPFLELNDERRTANDERDTAEQPVVLDPSAFARLYKTGDLARWRAEGALEFLGRRDGQIKLRGYRVELGEIEATLGQHQQVGECVVLLREDVPGLQQLVAYVVPAEDEKRKTNDESADAPVVRRPASLIPELRGFLAERLPEYMVPSALVLLDALPLTINGKIDRPALPAPERGTDSEEYIAPRTDEEKLLAQIWAAVLGRERVGVHDNFFELGGHSLLATQLISRIRDAFQIELPLRTIFELPTVAGLAERIQGLRLAARLSAAALAAANDEDEEEGVL